MMPQSLRNGVAHPKAWLGVTLVLILTTVLATLALRKVENQAAQNRVDQRAQAASHWARERITQQQRLLELSSLSQDDRPDRVFHDHFQRVLPHSLAEEFFWIEHLPAPSVRDKTSYLVRYQVGPKQTSLPLGLDLAQASWAREGLDRAFASNSATAISMPEGLSNQPRARLLIVFPWFRPGADEALPVAQRLLGFVASALPLDLLASPPHPEVTWQLETSTGQVVHLAPTDPSTWQWSASAYPVGAGLSLRLGTRLEAAKAQHGPSNSLFVLGLLLATGLGALMRSHQKAFEAAQAASGDLAKALAQGHAQGLMAIEALGLGSFALDAQGMLVRADDTFWHILQRPSSQLDGLSLASWWMGLGERTPSAALQDLAETCSKQGKVHTLIRLPNQVTRDVALSLVDMNSADQPGWIGVIEDLGHEDWGSNEQALVIKTYEQAPEMISLWSTEQNCLLINTSFAQWLGISPQEAKGKHLDTLLSATLREPLQAAGSGHRQTLDLALANPQDGASHIFEVWLDRIRLPDQPYCVRIIAHDVTAQRQTAALQETTWHDLNLLFHTAPLGVYLTDDEQTLIRSNAAFERLSGYSAHELQRTPWDLIAPKGQTEGDNAAIKQLRQAGRLLRYERNFRHKDGHLVPTAVYSVRLPGYREPPQYWFIVEDLTENRQQTAHLRAHQTIMQTAMEAVGEAFVIYDDQDRLYYCNERYRELYKTSASVLREGMRFEDILRYGVMHGQYPQALGREEEWLQERMQAHNSEHYMLEQPNDDGRWLKIVESKTPENYTVGFRMDITEQMRARQTAEAANQAKNHFLASMSHEIRTPLNGILGMAQVLQFDDITPVKRVEYAQTILDSGQVLMHLLNQVLDLAKIESGKVELNLEAVDPQVLCQQVVQLFSANAEMKNLQLSTEWLSAPALYLLDEQRLVQMLSNLMGNAVKFTDRGGARIEAKEVRREGQYATLEFAVIDTGPGISPEQQDKLFQPFSQLDASNSSHDGSSGLGLSIVKSMAELMGGLTGVDSTPGEGARFFFQISAERAGDMDKNPDSTVDAPAEDTHDCAQGVRVMIVEDSPVMLRLLRVIVESLGAQTVCFGDGQDALDALVKGDPAQVLLLDLSLPKVGGLVAAEMVRDMETMQGQKPRLIVAVTAAAYEQDRQACLDAGMDAVFSKPVSVDQLARLFLDNQARLQVTQSPTRAVDLEELERLWRKLEPQLMAHQYYAIPTFDQLYTVLTGTGHDSALRQAMRDVHAYNFETCLVNLRPIVSALLTAQKP